MASIPLRKADPARSCRPTRCGDSRGSATGVPSPIPKRCEKPLPWPSKTWRRSNAFINPRTWLNTIVSWAENTSEPTLNLGFSFPPIQPPRDMAPPSGELYRALAVIHIGSPQIWFSASPSPATRQVHQPIEEFITTDGAARHGTPNQDGGTANTDAAPSSSCVGDHNLRRNPLRLNGLARLREASLPVGPFGCPCPLQLGRSLTLPGSRNPISLCPCFPRPTLISPPKVRRSIPREPQSPRACQSPGPSCPIPGATAMPINVPAFLAEAELRIPRNPALFAR